MVFAFCVLVPCAMYTEYYTPKLTHEYCVPMGDIKCFIPGVLRGRRADSQHCRAPPGPACTSSLHHDLYNTGTWKLTY